MTYKYGEMFERLGILGMGHQGAAWCALDSEGTLVLMAHQNYFRGNGKGKYQYEHPPDDPSTLQGQSHKRSLDLIGSYFAEDRKIILLVGVFITDGGPGPDGKRMPSKFRHATGDYYVGRMKRFERETGYLLCDCDDKVEG